MTGRIVPGRMTDRLLVSESERNARNERGKPYLAHRIAQALARRSLKQDDNLSAELKPAHGDSHIRDMNHGGKHVKRFGKIPQVEILEHFAKLCRPGNRWYPTLSAEKNGKDGARKSIAKGKML